MLGKVTGKGDCFETNIFLNPLFPEAVFVISFKGWDFLRRLSIALFLSASYDFNVQCSFTLTVLENVH